MGSSAKRADEYTSSWQGQNHLRLPHCAELLTNSKFDLEAVSQMPCARGAKDASDVGPPFEAKLQDKFHKN